MGNFLDNHDNPRFLYQFPNIAMFHSGLAFTLGMVGIPIIYYGDEQNFNGGPDPKCREALWPHYNTESETYQYLKKIITFRKQTGFGLMD